MSAHVTVSLYLWWLWAYLAVGVVLWLPIEWWAWHTIHNPPPFWSEFRRRFRQRPWAPLLVIAVWPVAIWEVVR